jgi:hypothetical protein
MGSTAHSMLLAGASSPMYRFLAAPYAHAGKTGCWQVRRILAPNKKASRGGFLVLRKIW